MSLLKGAWSHMRGIRFECKLLCKHYIALAISRSVYRDASAYNPLIIFSLYLCSAVTAQWARRAVDVGKSLLDLAASIIT